MSRRALIAGNWKMNGAGSGGREVNGLALAMALREKLRTHTALRCDLAVCPPATLIDRITGLLRESGVAVGGQDCHAEASGAYTGDISAEMLAECGCRYVIVGHSERR